LWARSLTALSPQPVFGRRRRYAPNALSERVYNGGSALWARSLTALSPQPVFGPEALRAERAQRARLQERVDNGAALA